MITRRQLKELFKNIAESHKQINSFGWGDVPEILSRQDHIYPLMMVTPSDVVNEQGQLKHNYIISVADRLKKDISNQVDVDNDTQQIMADLIAILYNINYQNLSVELPLNITPFKNVDPQDVLGWYGTFSIIVDENYDYCAVPTEPIPFDPDPPFVCAPANYRVQYVGGELIEEGEIPSGGSVTVNVPVCPEGGSVEWELRDEDNNLLDSGTQPAGVPLTITAPDGLITIKDTDDGVLYVVNINSGGSVNQTINDSTVNINKSDGSLIFAQDVKAEGVENYNVADSVITLNNTVPTLISTTNVKATDTATIVAPDATVEVNGDNSFPTIPSGGSVNIGVENTNGAPVGAFDSNTNSWVIGDATFNLDNTSGATLFLGSIAAGDNETIIAPDGDIENSDASYTASVESGGVLVLPDQTIEVNTVNEGSIPSVGTIEIDITDGTNPVTPDDVTISGRTITIEVPSGGGMVADFVADKLVARQGEIITFTDLTTNSPTHWGWGFDNGQSSLLQNPTFAYNTLGLKNITLLAGKDGAGDVEIKNNYIEILLARPLTRFGNSAIGLGLRKLRDAYTGNCIRVRRSNDNTEQDIGFDGDDLDTTSLLAFVGANNGFVTTIYDQTGNSRDAVQATAANQPQIVSSGSLITTNGLPSIKFDGSNDFLSTSYTVANIGTLTVESVQKINTTANQISITISEGSNNQLYLQWVNSGNFFNFYAAAGNNTTPSTNQMLASFYMGASGGGFYQNGALISARSQANTTGASFVNIGRFSGGGSNSDMNFQELIIWESDKQTDRALIQDNINEYYDIY
jgi:PKD repeat protein